MPALVLAHSHAVAMWCRRSAADTYVQTEGCPYGKSYGEDTSSHSEGTFHESAFLSFRGRRARLTSSALEASVLVVGTLSTISSSAPLLDLFHRRWLAPLQPL